MILFALGLTSGTLEIDATSLAEALPRIGRAFGTTMRAAPSIGEEIVVARFERATLPEVEARLEREFAARWRTESDGTLLLVPAADRRRSEREEWFRMRRERLSRRFDALRREARSLNVLEAADAFRLRERTLRRAEVGEQPGSIDEELGRRLLARLVAGVRDEALIPGGISGELVFSLDPTEFQRSLSADARDAFRLYREERALLRALAREEEEEESPSTRLLLKTRVDGPTFRAELTLYDDAGDGTTVAEMEEGDDGQDSVLRRRSNVAVPFHFVPNVRRSDPLAFLTTEPLATEASGALLSAARIAGRSVVVAPSDRLLLLESPESPDLREWLGPERSVVRFDGPGWMTIETDHPYLVRSSFFPRRRLRTAVRMRTDGNDALRDRLALVRARPDTSEDLPGDRLLQSAFPGALSGDLASLRFLAALSPSEWTRAERRSVAFTSLDPRTRGLAIGALRRSSPSSDPEFRGFVVSCRFGPPSWSEEPTNAFASLRSATFGLRQRTVRLLEVRTKGKPQLFPLPVLERLSDVAEASKGRISLKEDLGIETDRLRLHTRREWDLLFGDPREAMQGIAIEDAPVLVDVGPYSLDRLPPAFRRSPDSRS